MGVSVFERDSGDCLSLGKGLWNSWKNTYGGKCFLEGIAEIVCH